MVRDFEIVDTRDGRRVIRSNVDGELMHPVGPTQEAAELYVTPSRLAERLAEGPITLFDVGLGGGSNAALAWSVSTSGGPLEILSFDRTTEAMALAVSEPVSFGYDDDALRAAREVLDHGHAAHGGSTWRLVLGELPETLAVAERSADVVFWDPYSPKTNPDLWNIHAFTTLRRTCAPRATVHTYGAATAVRAAMILAGFVVGRGPSTGTKSETTVAAVDRHDIEHPLDGRWLERFGRSSAPLPADAPPNARDRVRACVLEW